MPATTPRPASPLPKPDSQAELQATIARIEREAGARAIGVALFDSETGGTFAYQADRWFHAASTIKLAILLGVYRAIDRRDLIPRARLHVRNRFFSAAGGEAFAVSADRDANATVQAAIGKMMRVSELAHHMIATSSNLATNLLLDLVGLGTVQQMLSELDLDGIDVQRGVEDERAFDRGIINRVTAAGLVKLLRLIAEERAFTAELSREMLDVLHQQEFRNGIPARLPRAVRVAHKTGDISTVAHDAGVVYPVDRGPYVVAVLTEWAPEQSGRSAVIAEISHAIYDVLTRETHA